MSGVTRARWLTPIQRIGVPPLVLLPAAYLSEAGNPVPAPGEVRRAVGLRVGHHATDLEEVRLLHLAPRGASRCFVRILAAAVGRVVSGRRVGAVVAAGGVGADRA